MLLQVGVKALLKNNEGKFLLVRRNPEKYPDVGSQWDLPGGRIDPGSRLIDNLKREVMEEVNLELMSEVKLIMAQDILRTEKHVVRLTFTGEIEGDPKVSEEHLEAKWFSREEIKNLPTEQLDEYFKDLLKNNPNLL